MKKILVFGMTDIPGGVESVIMNYYRNIDKNKIQFDFLCNNETVAYSDEIETLGGTIYQITARSKNYKLYQKELKEFFEKNAQKYDTIWVNICSLANIDYLKMAKKYGIKRRIIHCHNSQNMDSKLRGLLHKYNKIFIRKYATEFWSCSDFSSPWFFSKSVMKSNSYKIIKNAIDLDKFQFNETIRNEYRKKLNIDKNTLVIGNVGRFHFQKNHKFIIEIFEKILEERKDSILLLIGTGEDEETIKQLVKEKDIEANVKFLGKRNDVHNLMQAMDVFLFPSLFEGLGIVLIEAQTSGLITFASSDNIPKEVCIDKEGFHFMSLNESSDAWKNAIMKKYTEKSIRTDNSALMRNCGYDIKKECQEMQQFFENN